MADKKFSALDPADTLSGTEIIPVIQAGEAVRTTPNDIAGLATSDVESVNSQTGDVVLDQDDIADGVTHKQYSATDKTKVGHITVTQAVDLDAIESSLSGHIANTSNPHSVTKAQVGLGNADNTSDANKPISTATQTALDTKVDENVAITGATKTKITYDAKGLVTSGADATTADIADSTNKRYVTDAEKTVIGNTSGTNTGDQTLPVKATSAEVDTGTNDTKFATPKALEDSSYTKKATYVYDTDVTVTEFFGSAVDLGTGGYCRVDAKETEDFIWLRIYIKFGTSMSIGSLPLTILASDLPVTVPDYGAQVPMPGNFGALSIPPNENQMYAPALNNVGGFGNCILFFSEYGASFMDYLMGSGAPNAPAEGSDYFGTIMIPKMTMGS